MRWTDSVGLTLVNRDLASLQLRTPSGQILTFHILQIFPFTSESKRMGIIVRVRPITARLARRPITSLLAHDHSSEITVGQLNVN